MDDLEEEVSKWKKRIRDTGRPVRYADSFREGWRKCEEKRKKKQGKPKSVNQDLEDDDE